MAPPSGDGSEGERREIDWAAMKDDIITGLLAIEAEREESVAGLETGEQIVARLYGVQAVTVHVIPGYTGGLCHGRLDVIVGPHDSFEVRVRQAIEHLAIQCPNDKLVVFKAAHWDPTTWIRHQPSFEKLGCRVFSKRLGSSDANKLVP